MHRLILLLSDVPLLGAHLLVLDNVDLPSLTALGKKLVLSFDRLHACCLGRVHEHWLHHAFD